jgi:NAD(P)-dependent dehydrogenase (short-subunit alcohol dehydrogenase family)
LKFENVDMADKHHQESRQLLITGAIGGMGRTTALLAAREGYDLLLADLSLKKLEELALECTAYGIAARCQYLDVTQLDTVESMVASLQAGGGINAIIHTVGLSPQMADSTRIIDVDLLGTVALLEKTRPQLKTDGCAVCIASMSAYMVPPNEAIEDVLSDPLAPDFSYRRNTLTSAGGLLENPGLAYAYAKKALKQYVADHAPAWGKEGKRFISLSPGLIDTEMGRLENAAMENFSAMRGLIALNRLGEPEDIANTALFLVSAKAAYITGCDILVDGGFVAALNDQQRRSR